MPSEADPLDPAGGEGPVAGPGVSFLDCGVHIGRRSGAQWTANRLLTAAGLLAELDRVGIDAAVVHHTLAREYSPRIGNELLADELPGDDRLLPAWLLLPHHTGEFPRPEEVVARMREAGVVMGRLHPSTDAAAHRFLLAEWVVGPLLDELERSGIPVALDFHLFRRAEPPWAVLHEVLRHHPGLKVILMEVQGRNNRTLYPLLERHDNLYVQSAGFNVHRGIEDFVARFGAERMVFGSGYPERSMGAARFHLETADISAADKQRIAAGNLRALLPRANDVAEVAHHA
ncbi:amidohydrolase family protein [Jiangella rhizosphaerae]|nr:amidohydrolase family protein [Jiangella rhizosphaerae]